MIENIDKRKRKCFFSGWVKIKRLLPSLREKKRYLVYEVISEKAINQEKIEEAVNKRIMGFLGEYYYGKAGVMLLNNGKDNKGIIKVSNKYLDHVKGAIATIKDIDNNKVIVKSIGVSGILNKALSCLLYTSPSPRD